MRGMEMFWESELGETISQNFLVLCGVIMASLASFITCLGLNLQKLSLCAEENSDVPSLQQPKWLAGLACVVVGSILDFLAFGLAPQSLLAPLAALSLVWNLGMAAYLLGEQYTKKDLYATLTIFIGTAISISNAAHNETSYTLQDLMLLWQRPRMVAYCAIIPALLLIHYILILFTTEEGNRTVVEKFGLHFTCSNRVNSFVRLLGYAGFAGIIGGQSLLFAKSIVEVLKSGVTEAMFQWQSYVLIFMLVLCLLLQINFLNDGLKGFDSLYVIPVYESYWIIAGVVGGLVYFGEWDIMTKLQSRLFVLGILITFSGLYILTQKHGKAKRYDAVPSKGSEIEIELELRNPRGNGNDMEAGP